jgi:hypothetical protein
MPGGRQACDEDCTLAPLLQRRCGGADQAQIGGWLRSEPEDHFGLGLPGLWVDAMAARVITWWASAVVPHGVG